MHRTRTVIIGAGQAGLAMSRALTQRAHDHVILERGRVAQRWSERWDSLRLLTPNWMSRLPEWSYDGPDPNGFMTRDEVIAYLGAFARSFRAPVRERTQVLAVAPRGDGWRVVTDRGTWQADNVVIATGHCAEGNVPDFAADAPAGLHQVSSLEYRNPGQLPPGGVLVVGASASGVQLADELRRTGRRVVIAVGSHNRLPREHIAAQTGSPVPPGAAVPPVPADGAPLAIDLVGEGFGSILLMRAGVLQLKRWGLLERVVASGAPAISRTVVHYGDQPELIELKPRAGVGELFAPRRFVLDSILADAAADAGAEVRYGTTVTHLLRDGSGRVRGVAGRDAEGRAFAARAAITVGADGLSSLVARQAAAPVTRQGRGATGLVYGYFSGLGSDRYDWFYRPGVAGGVVPTNDGEACVWVGAPAPRFMASLRYDLERSFARLLEEVAPQEAARLLRAPRQGRLLAFRGVPGFLRRPWGDGWALVGDASHFKDPISAHGITDALRDAELLAEAIDAALGGARREAEAKVRTPTLVVHAKHEIAVPFANGRYLATHIPGARFLPLESRCHLILEQDPAWSVMREEIEAFLAT